MRYEQPEMEILLFEGKVDTIDVSENKNFGDGADW